MCNNEIDRRSSRSGKIKWWSSSFTATVKLASKKLFRIFTSSHLARTRTNDTLKKTTSCTKMAASTGKLFRCSFHLTTSATVQSQLTATWDRPPQSYMVNHERAYASECAPYRNAVIAVLLQPIRIRLNVSVVVSWKVIAVPRRIFKPAAHFSCKNTSTRQ